MQKNFFSTDKSLYLSNGQKILLNDQQLEAINQIKKFLKSQDSYFLLSGFAGTGKTTVVKKFLMNILKSQLFQHQRVRLMLLYLKQQFLMVTQYTRY